VRKLGRKGCNLRKSPKLFYGYIIVLVTSLVLLVTQGTFFSFGIFFKPLTEDFGWTRAMTAGAFSLCSILQGLLFILTGRLNDRFGPRVVMTACGFILGAGYLLMSQIESVWQLYLYYGVIIAIGMSGGLVPMLSTVSRWFVKRRGLMTGIVSGGVGLGLVIVPPLTNWLISIYDWRTSYIIIGSASLVILVLAAQFLKRDPGQVGQLPYGEGEAEREKSGSEAEGFSLWEALHTSQFWLLSLAAFCFGYYLLTVMTHIVPHATDLGISAAIAASFIAIIGGVDIISRIMGGGIADRIGYKPAYQAFWGLVIVAFPILLIAREVWLFYLFAVLFGLAYGAKVALQSISAAELLGLKWHGAIFGTNVFFGFIGGATGSVLSGYIFDVTGSYQLAFIICIILSVVGLVLVSLLKPIRNIKREF